MDMCKCDFGGNHKLVGRSLPMPCKNYQQSGQIRQATEAKRVFYSKGLVADLELHQGLVESRQEAMLVQFDMVEK